MYSVCLCKKFFKSYDQTIIYFIFLTNENKNSEDNFDNDNDVQEPHDSDYDMTVDVYFYFLMVPKTITNAAMIKIVLLECVIHLTFNLIIYQKLILRIIFRLVLFKIKKTLKFSQLQMPPMKISRLELKLHTVVKQNELTISGSVLLCENASLLLRKRYGFHGSKSEKYFVQSSCASTKGTSFSLLYTEGAMFPSIFGRP